MNDHLEQRIAALEQRLQFIDSGEPINRGGEVMPITTDDAATMEAASNKYFTRFVRGTPDLHQVSIRNAAGAWGWYQFAPLEGADAISTGASDGEVLTADGSGGVAWEAAPLSVPNIAVYTANDTFDATAVPASSDGNKYVWVEVVGGGGGGGSDAGIANEGGGGAGGYSAELVDITGETSISVTVGAAGVGQTSDAGTNGGTSSFGAFLQATGGSGGSTGGGGAGGAGGSGSGGDINMSGQAGGPGSAATERWGGPGGSSVYGQGGSGVYRASSGDAVAASSNAAGYGAGGGGAAGNSSTGTGAGGNGTAGVVIVRWLS